ncbi:MAG: Alpha-ribazole phosphatase [Synergistales bacterium 53_16]|jgi:probable phosphoglycerate mutase|nr:MAG: Alpha-ribazole phosphatase [Synergistales bacterium 53_16]MDK2845781.1 hypothetical protein [Synergistales bacterium]MDN5335156.1 hypothetical protein [Synergistales bacterium]HAG21970.1 hypothetical protein [Synergistaceae bacterium]
MAKTCKPETGKKLFRESDPRDVATFPRPEEHCLVFVRHGEPAFPESDKYYLGKTDWLLSDKGKIQARCVADWAKGFSWRGCFCSPLKRAKETAEIICGAIDLPFTIKTELAEIDLGEWDGRKKTEIASAYPEKLRERQEDLLYFRHPCGESFAELEARVIPFLVPLLQEKGKWLVVSHAGVYRVLIHALFGVPFPMTFGYDLGYGQIRMFCRTGDYLFVKGFDELMVHLEELK